MWLIAGQLTSLNFPPLRVMTPKSWSPQQPSTAFKRNSCNELPLSLSSIYLSSISSTNFSLSSLSYLFIFYHLWTLSHLSSIIHVCPSIHPSIFSNILGRTICPSEGSWLLLESPPPHSHQMVNWISIAGWRQKCLSTGKTIFPKCFPEDRNYPGHCSNLNILT